MSKTKKLTIGFMILVGVVIAIYDIWVYSEPTPGDTISEVLLGWSMTFHTVALVIGLAIGFLLGHLFWPQRREDG